MSKSAEMQVKNGQNNLSAFYSVILVKSCAQLPLLTIKKPKVHFITSGSWHRA